jgi:hypothetical protein
LKEKRCPIDYSNTSHNVEETIGFISEGFRNCDYNMGKESEAKPNLGEKLTFAENKIIGSWEKRGKGEQRGERKAREKTKSVLISFGTLPHYERDSRCALAIGACAILDPPLPFGPNNVHFSL